MRINYAEMEPTSTASGIHRLIFAFLASFLVFTVYGCASKERPKGDAEDALEDSSDVEEDTIAPIPTCEHSPSELLGAPCEQRGYSCYSEEFAYSCCEFVQCQCGHPGLDESTELVWYCGHLNCDSCNSPIVCDYRPCADECPWSCDEGCISSVFLPFTYPEVDCASEDDAEDGDAQDGDVESDTVNSDVDTQSDIGDVSVEGDDVGMEDTSDTGMAD